jgi:hypothetical protein
MTDNFPTPERVAAICVEFAQIPYQFETRPSARAAIPCMRWWCTPAVDLSPRICKDCYNASAPGLIRCWGCFERHAQRTESTELCRDYLKVRAQLAHEHGDLADALRCDDTLEEVHGMHGNERVTCWQCRSWADHAHHPWTGVCMTRSEWDAYIAARPGIYGIR